ncbi:helix-turn-helix domain-containing protein [Paenibacillus sepulcri]|uniref:AraC family transcriptional regulator n=1 Tax=Paenibacillus sepulcri TaxID=359917 RepID=A0ABS7BWI1_9BACL|nr:AraC family transcriptional regulator [Paenibacillus sepulcri]
MDKSCLYSALKTHISGWVMGFHEHPHFEISVVVFGSGTFFMHNDDQAYPIHEGDIILIPPNVPHNFTSSTSIRFAVLQIQNLPAELQAIFFRMTRNSFLYSLSYIKLERYEALFNNWINSVVVVQSLNCSERVIKLWIELLLLFINDSIENVQDKGSLQSAADYVHNNYDKDIRISELAKMANMSENGFRSGFKKKFGQSPKQYLQAYRMSQAKLLLESSSKSIQQIGQQVGFPSIHAFSAWFQNIEGKSPSTYRKEK